MSDNAGRVLTGAAPDILRVAVRSSGSHRSTAMRHRVRARSGVRQLTTHRRFRGRQLRCDTWSFATVLTKLMRNFLRISRNNRRLLRCKIARDRRLNADQPAHCALAVAFACIRRHPPYGNLHATVSQQKTSTNTTTVVPENAIVSHRAQVR